MRRIVSLSLAALGAAALAALAFGFRAGDGQPQAAPRPASPLPDLLVTSRHVGRPAPGLPRIRILAGALASAPRFGVAVVDRGRAVAPSFLVADSGDGPLRIVEAADGSAVLRSARGLTYALDARAATLVPLGRRLDPDRLAVSRKGVAVPIEYGPQGRHRALLLVGFDKDDVPRLDGYLEGFALWRPDSPQSWLERPLLGPDGALYRVDPTAHRLERVAAPLASRRAWSPALGGVRRGCTRWPAGLVGTYEGCPGEIRLQRSDGSRTTVLSDPNCRDAGCRMMTGWERILPSPDGRTLLVQQGVYACGGQWTASFLDAGGGTPEPVVPALDFSSSWALGWLTGDVALVAAASQGEECGAHQSGIYVVDRRYPGFLRLVAATSARDATTWGW